MLLSGFFANRVLEHDFEAFEKHQVQYNISIEVDYDAGCTVERGFCLQSLCWCMGVSDFFGTDHVKAHVWSALQHTMCHLHREKKETWSNNAKCISGWIKSVLHPGLPPEKGHVRLQSWLAMSKDLRCRRNTRGHVSETCLRHSWTRFLNN